MAVSDSLWVTTIIDSGRGVVDTPFVASFLTLGWIPLAASLVVLRFGNPSQGFVVAQLLTASIVILGPYQAYKYDTEVLPGFFKNVSSIIADEDQSKVENIRSQALRLYGPPDRIRSYGLCRRRAALYPAELRAVGDT